MFAASGFGDLVNFIFGEGLNFSIQLFVCFRFFVFPFFFGTYFIAQVQLTFNLNTYCVMGYLQSLDQIILTAFVCFPFHHHQIFICCSNQKFEIRFFQFGTGWINNKFSVYFSYSYFTDGFLNGNIGDSQGCRCGKACQGIGHNFRITGYQRDQHLNITEIIFRK